MNIRVKLGDGVTALAVDEYGQAGKLAKDGFISIELPDGSPVSPEFIDQVINIVGPEFSDMAIDAVFRFAALAALQTRIQ
jgi:hypothetical protein